MSVQRDLNEIIQEPKKILCNCSEHPQLSDLQDPKIVGHHGDLVSILQGSVELEQGTSDSNSILEN
jgi:hypothetical protein